MAVEVENPIRKDLKEFKSIESVALLVALIFFVSLTVLLTVDGFRGEISLTETFGVCLLLLLPFLGQAAHVLRYWRTNPFPGYGSGWSALILVYLAAVFGHYGLLGENLDVGGGGWIWPLGAWVLLGMTFLLGWTAFRAVGEILQGKHRFQDDAVVAIVFFLGLFLTVTYLLSFSLLFMERSEPGEHLAVMTTRPSIYGAGPAGGDPHAGEAEGGAAVAADELRGPWRIYFQRSSFEVSMATENGDGPGGDSAAYLGMWNAATLAEICRTVQALLPEKRVMIQLAGRASEEPVAPSSRRFSNNYELSNARITHVAHALRSQLGANGSMPPESSCLVDREGANSFLRHWDHVQWLYQPLSSSGLSLVEARRPERIPAEMGSWYSLDDAYSVDVTILTVPAEPSWYEPPGDAPLPPRLSVLDFLYFTIYTITTTGYGDLVPISPFAKLVSSIANLFELFFLVVFFNVLLATILAALPERYLKGVVRP